MNSGHKQYRLPIQVLVYCFRPNGHRIEYLVLRRTPEHGGFWQGITGAPEGAETLLEAAAREVREETRLSPKELYQIDFSYSFPVQDDWKSAYDPDVRHIDEFVFLAEVATDVEPTLSFEHDLYEWADFTRAMSLVKWPNNREALEYCNRMLRHDWSGKIVIVSPRI